MNLKSLVLSVIVALSSALPAAGSAAEPAESRREAMELKIQELRDRLALTPEQEQKLAPLIEERNAKLKDLFSRRDAESSRREKRAMMSEARAIQQAFNAQIEPILTAEQKREWEAFRQEARAGMKERYRERRD
jgi:hypothetical protein